MNQKTINIFSLAVISVALFSCASNNKFSKKSYGGGWEDKVATQITDPSVETTVKNEPVTNKEEVTSVEMNPTPTVEIAHAIQFESKGHSSSLKLKSEVKPTKVSFKEKVATRLIQKKMAAIHSDNDANNVDNKVLLVILAILLPWLAVLLYKGVGTEFLISLLLWFLFVLPGIIYALLVVLDVI